MNRRAFLHSLFAAASVVPAAPLAFAATWPGPARKLLVQQSPVAGFQYHEGERLWPALAEGELLRLVREPENGYDKNAVRVEWRGRKLGYVPGTENYAVRSLMDRGERLSARIVRLERSDNPWDRIRFEVSLDGE